MFPVRYELNLYILFRRSGIGQGEAKLKEYKRPKLGCGQAYDRSSNCSFRVVAYVKA
jgi:hypothetical protein